MKETIADVRKRYFWKPLLESYSAPHAQVIDPVQQAYENGVNAGIVIGWNRHAAYVKVGKI